jgi:hypothetical protein
MRFVLAALAAFLVLMLDLDGPSTHTHTSPKNGPTLATTISGDTIAATFALFESAAASEQPTTVVRQEETASTDSSAPEPAPEQPAPSPMDSFCHALRQAAQ